MTGRKMAKPREKVRNALLHNYDTATNLASKVTLGRWKIHILVDDFGVHLKPLLDFFAGMPEDNLGHVTKDAVKWFKERVAP